MQKYFEYIFSLLKETKNALLSGLVLITPVYITILIIKKILIFIINFLLEIEKYLFFLKINAIPHIELFFLGIAVCIIGILAKQKTHQILIGLIEKKIISKMPLVKNIYQGTKKILGIFHNNTKNPESNKVAWVKLPTLNTYVIGFLVGELEEKYNPEKNIHYFSFFIPTTPNPITGHYIIAAENEFFFNSMTREEALSIIISGGIIRPDSHH